MDFLLDYILKLATGHGGLWEYVALGIAVFQLFPKEFTGLVSALKTSVVSLIEVLKVVGVSFKSAMSKSSDGGAKITKAEANDIADLISVAIATVIHALVLVIAAAIPMYYTIRDFLVKRKQKG